MTWLRDAVSWHYILGTLALIVVLILAVGIAFCVWLNSFDEGPPASDVEGEPL